MYIKVSSEHIEKIHIECKNEKVLKEIKSYFWNKVKENICKTKTEADIHISINYWWKKNIENNFLEPSALSFQQEHTNIIKNQQNELIWVSINNSKIIKNENHFSIELRENENLNLTIIKQTIRACIEKILFDKSYILLHASSIKTKENCFLITWEANSWKTTTMLHGLYLQHAEYISNDRVFAKNINGKLHVIWREGLTRIRKPSMLEIPILKKQMNTFKMDEADRYIVNNLFEILWWWSISELYISHILSPNINNDRENKINIKPQQLITENIILDVPWINLYKDLFWRESIPTNLDTDLIPQLEVTKLNGINSIKEFFKK